MSEVLDHQGKPAFRGYPPRFVGNRPTNHYSKRDYEAFARILKDAKPVTTVDNKDPANVVWADTVNRVAEFFKQDNPRFDLIKFVARLHEHEQISAGACFQSPEHASD